MSALSAQAAPLDAVAVAKQDLVRWPMPEDSAAYSVGEYLPVVVRVGG